MQIKKDKSLAFKVFFRKSIKKYCFTRRIGCKCPLNACFLATEKPISEEKMKSLFGILIMVVMALSLTHCGGANVRDCKGLDGSYDGEGNLEFELGDFFDTSYDVFIASSGDDVAVQINLGDTKSVCSFLKDSESSLSEVSSKNISSYVSDKNDEDDLAAQIISKINLAEKTRSIDGVEKKFCEAGSLTVGRADTERVRTLELDRKVEGEDSLLPDFVTKMFEKKTIVVKSYTDLKKECLSLAKVEVKAKVKEEVKADADKEDKEADKADKKATATT